MFYTVCIKEAFEILLTNHVFSFAFVQHMSSTV
jgi:hypothetical protein